MFPYQTFAIRWELQEPTLAMLYVQHRLEALSFLSITKIDVTGCIVLLLFTLIYRCGAERTWIRIALDDANVSRQN